MKKTKKQESLENILNYEELKLIKGGKRKVTNVNWTTQCNCDYNNAAGVYNINGTAGCSCTCI